MTGIRAKVYDQICAVFCDQDEAVCNQDWAEVCACIILISGKHITQKMLCSHRILERRKICDANDSAGIQSYFGRGGSFSLSWKRRCDTTS